MICGLSKAFKLANKFYIVSRKNSVRGMSELLLNSFSDEESARIEERRETIVSNLLVVKQRMVESCIRAERDTENVKLVAVSKTKPSSEQEDL